MIKIVSLDIVDLIPFQTGILFVIRDGESKESSKISFYSFDIKTRSIASVTKNAYLLTKFGSTFSSITAQLNDYISCDAAKLINGQLMIMYSSGEYGIFDENGNLVSTDTIYYKNSPARDITVDDSNIWCAVPEKDLIIKFSVSSNRVLLRIGGENSDTFSCPVSVTEYDGNLYVCNSSSRCIKKISLTDFSVSTYKEFDEPVYKYVKVEDSEFVILNSGVYLI